MFFADDDDGQHGWCGPVSIGAALWRVGVDATPEAVARSGGRTPSKLKDGGMSEDRLEKAATASGASVETLVIEDPEDGDRFASTIKARVREGGAAVVSVNYNGGGHDHWVAVIDESGGDFLVVDSNDVDQEGNGVYWWDVDDFVEWAWNGKAWDPEDLKGNYFALLIDGAGPTRTMNAKLHAQLDDEVFVERSDDLRALVERSELTEGEPVSVSDALIRHGPAAIEECSFWTPDSQSELLKDVVRELKTVADARYPRPLLLDEAAFAMSLTALLSRTDHL